MGPRNHWRLTCRRMESRHEIVVAATCTPLVIFGASTGRNMLRMMASVNSQLQLSGLNVPKHQWALWGLLWLLGVKAEMLSCLMVPLTRSPHVMTATAPPSSKRSNWNVLMRPWQRAPLSS